MKKLISFLCMMFLVFGLADTGSALTTYSNEADFLAATGPLNFEGFEELPVNNSLNLPMITATDFAVSAAPFSPGYGLGIFNSALAGAHATQGSQYLLQQSNSNYTTTFTFNSAINAFGFDLIDYGDFAFGQLTLVNNAGDNAIVAVSGGPDGNVQYWGMISDFMFTTAILTNTIPGESFAFDRVSYGTTAVPEPGTLLLLGSGLIALAGYGRKKFLKRR